MSAESRSRQYMQLPIAPWDFIIGLHEADDVLVAQCVSGRVFLIERAIRYKRKFKVRELPPVPSQKHH